MGGISKAAAPRVHWDAALGWVVDSRFALNRLQLQACVDFTRKYQTERIRSMPPGDRKDQAKKALATLSVETLKLNLLPADPLGEDRILY